jgi:hypothetical protein
LHFALDSFEIETRPVSGPVSCEPMRFDAHRLADDSFSPKERASLMAFSIKTKKIRKEILKNLFLGVFCKQPSATNS